ncbi:MAG: phage tail sheath family protein, partial [Parvibaculaceae bacterium]
MQTLKAPGVYVQEIATLPPSVAEVSTAIPAFIGRTQRGTDPARISSFIEYQALFGAVQSSTYSVRVTTGSTPALTLTRATENVPTTLYYYLSHYFTNGGGPCWIFPAAGNGTVKQQFLAALALVEQEDEPTLILFPEAADLLELADYGDLAKAALMQCNKLKDRFTVLDVPKGNTAGFRDAVGINNLSYGAAYHPYLATTITWLYDDDSVQVQKVAEGNVTNFARSIPDAGGGVIVGWLGDGAAKPKVRIDAGEAAQDATFTLDGLTLRIGNAGTKTGAQIVTAWTAWKAANQPAGFDIVVEGAGGTAVGATAAQGLQLNSQAAASAALSALKTSETALYNLIKDALSKQRVTLPPSAAMGGIYASVDRDRGVWKAPATVSVAGV